MEHCLTLPSDVADLARLSAWLAQLRGPGALSDRDFFRLELAVVEAVTNVIEHGSPKATLGAAGAADWEITVRLVFAPEEVTASVIDNGKRFDPLSRPENALPKRLEDATPGGLGIYLIRKYTDRCAYEWSGETNRLIMVFQRPTNAPG